MPGADSDLSINFFFAKQSQNLDGLPSSVENTFSTSLAPISCLACVKYCLRKSAKPQVAMCWVEHTINVSTCFLLAGRLSIHWVQWKSWLSWYVKLWNGQRVHFILSLAFVWTLLKLLQALCDIQRQIDEKPVCLTPDFVGSEKHIGFEVVQCFIEDIGIASFSGCWTSKLGFHRKNSHVSYDLRWAEKLGMISLDKTPFNFMTNTQRVRRKHLSAQEN